MQRRVHPDSHGGRHVCPTCAVYMLQHMSLHAMHPDDATALSTTVRSANQNRKNQSHFCYTFNV